MSAPNKQGILEVVDGVSEQKEVQAGGETEMSCREPT